jgi:hypothetical protein
MSSIGLYETVPISYVRDQAKMMLRMQNDNSIDDEIDFWVSRGLQRLNCLSTLTKINCTIPVCGSTAELPNGLVELIAFRMPYGEVAQDLMQPNYTYYYNAPFFKNNSANAGIGWIPMSNFCQINGKFIMFNIEPATDEIEISYIGANVNDCGERIIYERYQDALAYFACYNIGHARQDENKFPQVAEWKQMWLNQRNMLIGKDQNKSFRENINKIRAIMLSPYFTPRLQPNG